MQNNLKYIDIHCHVNFSQYDADRDEVLRRAQEAGVGMIVVGTDPESSQSAVALAEKYENIWAVIGLHPAEKTGRDFVFDYELYKKLAAHPKVVGIGECGLDYFHADPAANAAENRALQVKIFEDQIRVADEMKKPLMLHVRNGVTGKGNSDMRTGQADAYSDVIDILKKSQATGMSVKGNVHFFAGGPEYAREFIELGFHLSFTGVITFAKEYHEVIRMMPLDRIMSETDAPFVAPLPYRGKRNEPAYVVLVAKAIAAIRNANGGSGETKEAEETEETVLKALVNNAKNLFNI